MRESATQNEAQELFRRYLEICNEAVQHNRDRFPYKPIWDAVETLMKDREVAVAIYDDRPKETCEVTLQDHQLKAKQVDKPADGAWHVNMSYLERVVRNPEEYIHNPAKIDWEWLRNRLEIDR